MIYGFNIVSKRRRQVPSDNGHKCLKKPKLEEIFMISLPIRLSFVMPIQIETANASMDKATAIAIIFIMSINRIT
ncbi:MAG: hypothetical protein U9O65_07680 [Thermotogota bacterium]|nr:hypothetical protein [Thermotogota bacterium]